MLKLLPLILVFTLILPGCGRSRQFDVPPPPSPLALPAGKILPIPAVAPLPADALQPADIDYREQLTFKPEEAKYLDLITGAVPLNADELEMLSANGFVTTDRHAWARFIEAYAWIYWKDLPVLVTTDSILHTVHQSYSDILMQIERSIIFPEMVEFLEETHDAVVKAEAANDDEALAPLYVDVKIYLETAYQLLLNGLVEDGESSNDPAVLGYVQIVEAANAFYKISFGWRRARNGFHYLSATWTL